MNTKKKGSRNEYRSMRLLEAAGYSCTKSGASLGAWDVIGVSSADVVFCQVKSNSWPRSDEMETLRNFRVPPNCRKIIHVWKDRQRLPMTKEL